MKICSPHYICTGPAEAPTDVNMVQNATSSSLTIQWKEGRSGNMPPVIYVIKIGESISSNCEHESGFSFAKNYQGLQQGITGTQLQTIVERLQPETEYCIHIHGENQRTGINTTYEYECRCGFKTIG